MVGWFFRPNLEGGLPYKALFGHFIEVFRPDFTQSRTPVTARKCVSKLENKRLLYFQCGGYIRKLTNIYPLDAHFNAFLNF